MPTQPAKNNFGGNYLHINTIYKTFSTITALNRRHATKGEYAFEQHFLMAGVMLGPATRKTL